MLETVFFFRALRSKGARGDIAGWALAGLFLGLTHYTTLVMSAVQGITLLHSFLANAAPLGHLCGLCLYASSRGVPKYVLRSLREYNQF